MPGIAEDVFVAETLAGAGHAPVCGRVTGFGGDSEPLVEYPGGHAGPVAARVLAHCRRDLRVGSEVLLVFERGDPAAPIVAGVFANLQARETPFRVSVDGRRVELEAGEEIALQCGQSSIVLRGDGRIVIQGAEIVSRASGTNKVRGASVKIN
jgi:hypothetical protein